MPKDRMNRRPARLLLALAGALLLFALLGLTGCKQDNRQLSLYDNETRAYTHPCIGAAMTVPAAWKRFSKRRTAWFFALRKRI